MEGGASRFLYSDVENMSLYFRRVKLLVCIKERKSIRALLKTEVIIVTNYLCIKTKQYKKT